jgi:hypothetical protein
MNRCHLETFKTKILIMKERTEWWNDSVLNTNIITSFWLSVTLLASSLKFVSTNHPSVCWTKSINIHILTISSSLHVAQLFRQSWDNHNNMTVMAGWSKMQNQTLNLSGSSRKFSMTRQNVSFPDDEIGECCE